MHPGGRFLCLRTVQKGKPSLLLLQVDVVGQTSDVQRGQLGLDQRAGVLQELLGHLGVVFVHPAQRHLLLEICDLADGVQLCGALVRAVGDALQGHHLAGNALKGRLGDCNKYMKFRHLLDWARAHGMEYVVTGHYARVEQDKATGRFLLKKGLDEGKDQSYVLYNLTQEQLAHIRLPLGGLHKTEVREIAEQHKFVNARKHDSQDICFVPDGDYARFMEDFTGKHYPAGDFLDENGRVVGTHNGAVRYTIGQRKGLGLAMGAPVYVCGKDMQANTVTVGPEEMLFDRIVYADEVNWIAIPELTGPLRVTARTRYHQVEQAATVYPAECGFRLEFDQPQRAPTPGQAVVLYQGDTVLGGGTITRVEK